MTVTELKRASDEDLQRIADGMLRKHGIPESYESIAAELLSYREATAPKMAEVDALVAKFSGLFMEMRGTFGISVEERKYFVDRFEKLLTDFSAAARPAILACEKEKQRADELIALLTEADSYNLLGEIRHMANYDGENHGAVVTVPRQILEKIGAAK